MKFAPSFASLACFLIVGCASAPKFSEVEFPRPETDLTIMATQQEIESETSDTDAMAAGGGVLGVMIASGVDSTRNRRAEEAITPLRDRLIDYDLGGLFVDHIQQSRIGERLVGSVDSEIRTEEVILSEFELHRPMIVLNPRVRLSNNMLVLLVDLEVGEIVPRESDGRPTRGTQQKFRFLWPLDIDEKIDREEAVAAWQEYSNDELIELIELGMDQTLQMLSSHLDEGELIFSEPNNRININTKVHARLNEGFAVWPWRESGAMIWLANKNGNSPVYSLPAQAIR